ncbi:hypothetical protein BH23CHL2_BH23CHL2_02790 [soil metagenome]
MTDTSQLKPAAIPDGIEILRPSDLGSIRIPWDARYSRDEVADIVRGEPSLSLWNERTGGYLLASPWRHRTEIANVIDIVGPSVSVELLKAFIAHCEDLGFELAIVAEYAERRRESFYALAGMEVLEDIIVYELGRLLRNNRLLPNDAGLTFNPVDLADPSQFQELLDLDHRAFPWLWWNSRGEFENYNEVPGVAIEIARSDAGRVVGYIGTTTIGTWGHLDRIAVDPDLQGGGYGRALLDYTIQRLASLGARRIALSTQASNLVSQALYESVGFRRSRSYDYRIYGRRLSPVGGI